MKIKLSVEEKSELEYRHRHESDGRVRDRIKSILLRDEDWAVSKIAQALRIHNDTVSRYICDYIESQNLTFHHKGSTGKLDDTQTNELIQHLNENTYDKASAVAEYVKSTYDAAYTISGMTHWLKFHGFSYKFMKGQSAKANQEKQLEFIQYYNTLKQETSVNEPILFVDAMHPTMATKIERGWIAKGYDKIIPTTGSRTRVNIVGAIQLSTMNIVTDQYETVNAKSMVSFFEKIKLVYPDASKIHIVLDQSGYHRSDELANSVKNSRIKLHFLPPYSPNLNPIERLWKVMNEFTRNNYFFKSAKDFRERIDNFFNITFFSIAENLRSRINDNFQLLNYAK